MNALLRPAIVLMNRLKYPQKFLLVGLVLILPLGMFASKFLSEVNADVDTLI